MDFDLEDYKQRTAKLAYDDLRLAEAFAEQPLDAATLRCLRYMHDVEFHTVCYLRDLLLTPAHEDPEITTFLSFWVFEELFHGEAIAEVLAAHGEAHGAQRVGPLREGHRRGDRLKVLLTAMVGPRLGKDFTGIHMAWGAINEWTTQAGYARLAQRAGHPVLSELLRRIMKQEGRHIDFYASQAELRLGRNTRAQRLARLAVRRFWRPVGAGVMPAAETSFLIRHLFDGDEGLAIARRIDRRVDRLPGLAGLRLIESTVDAERPASSAGAPQLAAATASARPAA